jgi:RNA polymerase sigma-70 factor, ECF subfamily
MPHKLASPVDAEILAAVRALQGGGPPEAFEVIYRRFYPPLFHFFANQPALREEADDLAQATLLRAYQGIGGFRGGERGSFWAWLRTIAENVWKNAVRERTAAKRAAAGEMVAPRAPAGEEAEAEWDLLATVKDELPDPQGVALARERTRKLAEAIAGLPAGMRLCAELRLFADLKYEEIAKVTGIGLNSVRSQLFEARRRIKAVLEPYFRGFEI